MLRQWPQLWGLGDLLEAQISQNAVMDGVRNAIRGESNPWLYYWQFDLICENPQEDTHIRQLMADVSVCEWGRHRNRVMEEAVGWIDLFGRWPQIWSAVELSEERFSRTIWVGSHPWEDHNEYMYVTAIKGPYEDWVDKATLVDSSRTRSPCGNRKRNTSSTLQISIVTRSCSFLHYC